MSRAEAEGDARPAVLLVDDVDANLVALEALLGSMDCDLVRASSGNAALRHLLKRSFAAVLLDVQMPEMDGYEVARYARSNPATSDTPIIFLTAMHQSDESILLGYGSGAVDYLLKPINAEVLRSKVRVFLDLYRSRRHLADTSARLVEANDELARNNARLARLAADLEEANRELDSFSYSVSHDLRAPLRSIAGFSEALLEDNAAQLDERGNHYLTRIRSAAARMGELIDDLLQLSRVSRAELRSEAIDLSALARGVLADLARAEPARDVSTSVEDGLTAAGDRRLLLILLENLIGNAWKYTSKTESARVEIGHTAVSDERAFFVRDNGVGFDPQFSQKLFAPFQRLHDEATYPGTGIGLATVKRIVQRHGGRVWAESGVGKGATFYFTVPRTTAGGPR